MKRRTPLRRKTRLKPVSTKRALQNQLYKRVRMEYLAYTAHCTARRRRDALCTMLRHIDRLEAEQILSPLMRQCLDGCVSQLAKAGHTGSSEFLRNFLAEQFPTPDDPA